MLYDYHYPELKSEYLYLWAIYTGEGIRSLAVFHLFNNNNTMPLLLHLGNIDGQCQRRRRILTQCLTIFIRVIAIADAEGIAGL